MKMKWWIVFVVLLGINGLVVRGEDNDEDDDGVSVEVEDETTEKVPYKPPTAPSDTFFAEPFHSEKDFNKRWVASQAKKEGGDENIAHYDGKWKIEEPSENAMEGDLGLVLKSKAKHHAVSSKLKKPFEFSGKPLIVQYEVKFQNGIECGGAYVKLLSKDDKLDLKNFRDSTPYTIMFGPDKCGADHKLHFIFRHKNPKTGEFEEKHAKKTSGSIDKAFSDKKTHLYTLIVSADNTYEILLDNKVVNEGNLLEDFSPPVNPPKEIDDPKDKKPADWDEREKISDPDAKKPDDWDESQPEKIVDEPATMPSGWLEDESELIPDPEAEKPEDWDEDMDGDWEAPLISNPKCKDAPGCGKWEKPMIKNPLYKGKWYPSMIDNPNYQGIWKPKRIANPNYFEDDEPYKMTPIDALGLELWSMTDDIVFDNFLVTDDRVVAETWAAESWEIKKLQEGGSSGSSVIDAIIDVSRDKPWIWAVLLIVVVLPIVLIVAYCCISRSQKGMWQALKGAADLYPWLWAVYVVVLLLPLLLLAICCCPASGPITKEVIDAHKKKTDESSPDDETKEEEVSESGDNKPKTKKSKASLEAEEDKPPTTDEEGEDADDDGEAEENEEDEEEDKATKSEGSPRRSPRKRRPRKE